MRPERLVLTALIVSVGGCDAIAWLNRNHYTHVDEACPDSVWGEEHLDEGTEQMARRLSCFRRFVDLDDAWVDYEVQQATKAHAKYLEENEVLVPGSLNEAKSAHEIFVENMNLPFATGASVLDRLDASDATDALTSFGVWDVFLGTTSVERADSLIANPFIRDVFFQPQWLGMGYAELPNQAETAGYFNVVYSIPPDIRIDWPVVYPKEGQVDVPRSYQPLAHEDNPLYAKRARGFPITITVGSWESDVRGAPNPYGMKLLDVRLVDEFGEEHETAQALPRQYPWGDLQATVIIAPIQPLVAGVTYEMWATISWLSIQEKEVYTRFTAVGSAVIDDTPDVPDDNPVLSP